MYSAPYSTLYWAYILLLALLGDETTAKENQTLDLLLCCLSASLIFLSLVSQNRRRSLLHQMYSSYCCSFCHLQSGFYVACFTYLSKYVH